MVGHFGAPDRMSYTALGDGVNLSSRLEGLNKQYGTCILASEAVRDAAGDAFAFRLLDLVAVKGKTRGVAVYELLGRAGEVPSAVLANAPRVRARVRRVPASDASRTRCRPSPPAATRRGRAGRALPRVPRVTAAARMGRRLACAREVAILRARSLV